MIVVNSDGPVNSYWMINGVINCCKLDDIKNNLNNLNDKKEEDIYNRTFNNEKVNNSYTHKTVKNSYNSYKNNRNNDKSYKSYNQRHKRPVIKYTEVTDSGTIYIIE
jgi:hypothetical protein